MTRPVVAAPAPVVLDLLLIVGIINIPIKVGKRAWRRCFGLMARNAGIFGINECLHPDQRELFLRLARKLGLGQYGTRIGPNPVFWDARKYSLVRGRQVKLHAAGTSAKARRYPGFNEARRATDVILAVHGTNGVQIGVINVHMAPGGKKVPTLWLIWARRQSKKVIRGLIAEHHEAGREVVVIGDTNIFREFVLGTVRWLRARGVDKVGIALTSAARLVRHRVRLVDAPTDHEHGVVVRIRLAITTRSAA